MQVVLPRKLEVDNKKPALFMFAMVLVAAVFSIGIGLTRQANYSSKNPELGAVLQASTSCNLESGSGVALIGDSLTNGLKLYANNAYPSADWADFPGASASWFLGQDAAATAASDRIANNQN